MKKIGTFILILLMMIILSSCKKDKLKPDQASSKTDYNDTSVINLEKDSANDVLFRIVDAIYSYESYKATTTGSTISTLFGMEIVQQIDSIQLKNNDGISYIQNSSSDFLTTYHEAYFTNNSVTYRDDVTNEFTTLSYEDYVSEYGQAKYDKSIEGFIITPEAIKSSKIEKTDDKYVLTAEIDGEIAGTNNKIQMKKTGSLSDYPTFKQVLITIIVNENYIIESIEVESYYDATLVLAVECHQKYTVSYFDINQPIVVTFPN